MNEDERLFLSVVIVIFLLFAFPFQSFAAEKETAYDRVVASGVIRCGYGISPPVLVQDPNTKVISGLDFDIWQEIGKELGLKIDFVEEAGWGNFIEGLRGGRYDAFCSEMWADPSRTRFLSLTRPVLYSSLKTYVRADDRRFEGNLERINDPAIKIPVIDGDVSVAVSQGRFPRAGLLTLPQTATVSEMMESVKTGKADVIFLDQGMIGSFEKTNPGVLRAVGNVPPAFVFGSYYGVLSGETQLRDMINVALQAIIDDGRMERLARAYSSEYVIPQKGY